MPPKPPLPPKPPKKPAQPANAAQPPKAGPPPKTAAAKIMQPPKPMEPPKPVQLPASEDGPADGATVDDAAELGPQLSFWQKPFVQNYLPFITSLLLHASILVLGIGFASGVQKVIEVLQKEEVVIPDAAFVDGGDVGGVPHPGVGGDASRDAAQDKFPDVPADSKGWNDNPKTKDMAEALGAGGPTDPNADNTIGVSPGGGTIFGRGTGATKTGIASGGEGGGPLAPYGVPGGGGGIGPKCNFIGVGGNAKRVVFICDGSGSMIPKWDLLNIELQKAVKRLKPPQSFNIVFFVKTSAGDYVAFNKNELSFASPDNVRNACSWVDNTRPEGETDPNAALKMAFAQNPQLIFLLTDGDFQDNKAVVELIQRLNGNKVVKINTIAFVDKGEQYEKVLKQIASENGGIYRFVSKDQLGQ